MDQLRFGRLLPVALLAAACAPSPVAEPVPVRPALAAVVDVVVNTPPLDRTQWGILVYDPGARRVVYALNAERHFVPASNNKLVIGAAALAELGLGYRYRTDLYAVGRVPCDSLAGSLVLLARGDPTWSERFHATTTAVLDSLADSLAWAGIRRVTGDLVVDASYFDAAGYHPTWQWGWWGGAFAAPTAAFAIDEGALRLAVEPGGAVGEPARVKTPDSPGGVIVINELVTGDVGTPPTLRIHDAPGSDTVRLEGVVPADWGRQELRRAAGDPAGYAAHALAAAVARRGVVVEGDVRVTYLPVDPRDMLPATPCRVATWTSPPMYEIVLALMPPSQNWMTEQVTKTLGAERGEAGTWPEGLAAAERFLYHVAGVDSGSVQLRDGSGLSHQNLLSPEAVVRLLDHARVQPWAHAFRNSLPRPGEEGTLRNRLRGLEGRVAAKTGTLANVNALSGYILAADGRELIFSIFTNATGRDAAVVRDGIDRIVAAIAEGGP